MATITEALAMALEHHQAGRLQAAAKTCREILYVEPQQADAWNLLGVCASQVGNNSEAVEYFQRALKTNPSAAEYHSNLGNVLKAQGQLEKAEVCYRQALAVKPGYAAANYNLGNLLRAQGKLDQAEACYWKALEFNPRHAKTYNNLGDVLQAKGLFDQAVVCYRQALALKQGYAEAHNNLGNALNDQGKLEEAEACYRQARALKQGYTEAHNNLGNVLKDQGKLGEAEACYRQAVALKPDFAEAYCNLGNALKDQGKSEEALACYQHALELNPDFVAGHSNFLCAVQYQTGVTLTELAELHAEFERQHAAPLRVTWQPHDQAEDPDCRLRLGFVSADLGRHPVAYFLVRVLEHLDQQQVEIACYSDRLKEDELTARFKAVSTTWRKIVGWSDERVAEQIREDGIDILIDLAGHTAGNRLLVFARRPAPIQMTWLGYVGTTGLAAIDYLLADRYEIPSSADSSYQEEILRMPDGYVCYDPPSYAPPISSLPALKQGFVTFGSFNNPAKLTASVLEVWAKILQRVPNSQLVLKYRGMNDAGVSGRMSELLFHQGIDVRRVEFLGNSHHEQLLAEYGRIDLALDSFPYGGGLTTCEALWMGVPVVTCPGETFASRHSLSHLSNVGLTETIARDLQEYVDLAVGLANDVPRLAELRAGLRARMVASPLCDGPRFAKNLLAQLREVWRLWTESNRVRS